MFKTQTIQVTCHGIPVRVHLVSTGAVAVKTKFREAKYTGIWAIVDFILEKKFTEWMPIWCLVIEHPEGIFVIDTGENADVSEPGYFKSSGRFANWFDTTQFKFIVNHDEEIGPQLDRLGIAVESVKAVVLTHLHLDHIDGLKYFPSTPIIVNQLEWQRPFGDLPKLYPPWFKPQLVDLHDKYDVFEKVYFLTESRDLILIQTPGHTYHHCSVLLNTDAGAIFFAADICYSQYQLLEGKYSGSNASHKLAADTYRRVREFSQRQELIFLPSHDAEAGQRLAEMRPIM